MQTRWILASIVILVAAPSQTLTAEPEEARSDLTAMVTPQYNDEGHLIRPTNFRTWIFVGASIGLSYFGKEEPKGPGLFHHIYIQPEAYRHYVRTGKFPDKTMLVMENYSAGSKEDNTTGPIVEGKEFDVLHGRFEDKRMGLEVALKDLERFDDGWAYFNFSSAKGLKETGAAFPKAVCWSCHSTHAADDNVFVQFYPVLREHLEKRLKDPQAD